MNIVYTQLSVWTHTHTHFFMWMIKYFTVYKHTTLVVAIWQSRQNTTSFFCTL